MADFQTLQTDAWFDNNVQKIASISASIATSAFNAARLKRCKDPTFFKFANFDSRVFTISDPEEVVNALLFRQQDASRNSVQSVARSMFSHKELEGKNSSQMQEMIFQKSGMNWNDYPVGQKRGRTIVRRQIAEMLNVPTDWENDVWEVKEVVRNKWMVEDPPIFSQDRNYLGDILRSVKKEVDNVSQSM